MRPNVIKFLTAVLGPDGSKALVKAAERSETLETALAPRTILAWLQFASLFGHDGEIPGIDGSHFEFTSTGKDSFDGLVKTDVFEYRFEKAPLLHLAAITAVALGVDSPVAPEIRQSDVAKLGKSLDILIGGRYLNLAKKALEESTQEESTETEESDDIEKDQEAPGQAAGPRTPLAPTAAAPQMKQPKTAKPPSQFKVTKNQAQHHCRVCDEPQFSGDDLTFCFCLRDLKKFANSTPVKEQDAYVVRFGPEWTPSDIAVFIDMIED